MRTLHAQRITLVPVEGRNARELWEVLNAPDLRKYQDIPRVRAEEFQRQVRTRPKALRPGALATTYLNLRKASIYGGSNEIQKNIIAQTILGL